MVLNDLLENVSESSVKLRKSTSCFSYLTLSKNIFDPECLNDNLRYRKVRMFSAISNELVVWLEDLRPNYHLTAETKPCCFCGRSTHEYSELYEGYICSEECEMELRKELYEKDIEVE